MLRAETKANATRLASRHCGLLSCLSGLADSNGAIFHQTASTTLLVATRYNGDMSMRRRRGGLGAVSGGSTNRAAGSSQRSALVSGVRQVPC